MALAPRTPANQQSASGLRVPHRAGQYRPGGPPFSSPLCWSCRCMEGFLIRGWDLILPGWRWLHEPQPSSNQPVGFVFHTVRRGFDPGDHRFRHRCVGVAGAWKDFSSGDRTLSSSIFPRCRWLHDPQPISNQPVRLGFPHRAGRYRPWDHPFLSPVRWNCRCLE